MPSIQYPKGISAWKGPVPPDYVEVHRWINANEVRIWLTSGGTQIPSGLGSDHRLYVTLPNAPNPTPTSRYRVEFAIPSRALHRAGRADWKQIFAPWENIPIFNVRIVSP